MTSRNSSVTKTKCETLTQFIHSSQEEQFHFKCRFTSFIDLNDVVVPFCKAYCSCTDPGKLGLPETSLVDRLELLAGSSSVFSRIWDVFRFPTLEEVATITWDALQQLKVLIHRESLLKAKLLCKHFIKIKDNSICLHLRLRLRLFLRLRLRLCLFTYCGFCSNRILHYFPMSVSQLVTSVISQVFSIIWSFRPCKPYALTNLITRTTLTTQATLTTWTTWTTWTT